MTFTTSEILELKRIIVSYSEILKTVGAKDAAKIALPGIKIAIEAVRKMERVPEEIAS